MSGSEVPAAAARRKVRRRDAVRTREEILAAAGRQFSSASYAGVRLKDIADEVGITAPLVVRYFGSKRELFREVVHAPGHRYDAVIDVSGPLEHLGVQLARALVEARVNPGATNPVLALIRSFGDPEARELFREEVELRLTGQLLAVLEGPDAKQRASLVVAQLMGFGFLTAFDLVEPTSERASRDELERMVPIIGAALQCCLTPQTDLVEESG